MEFKEVVKNRYSCKKFSDRQVENEKLTAILEAGGWPRRQRTCRNSMFMWCRWNRC